MSQQSPDLKVIQLDNLERRVFWYSLVIMFGLAAAALGAVLLQGATNKSLDQLQELSQRAERLAAAPAASTSEPPKA